MTLWVYRGASTTNVEGNHASTLWAVLSPEFSGIARNLWGGLLIINVVVIFVKNGKCCISTLTIFSLCRWGFNPWNPPIGYATAWVCYAWSTWLHYENTWLLWWSGRMHKTSILDSRNQLSLSQQCQTIILVDLYMKNYEVQFLLKCYYIALWHRVNCVDWRLVGVVQPIRDTGTWICLAL